jgi:D-glycero-D-manno-heptose 1,7-bisphosphate phosphatase
MTVAKVGALFLDRDGVINVDHGYVHRPDDVEFVPGIFELVRSANESNLLVVVVTNQAGIARGLYSPAAFEDLMRWMLARFRDVGARLDAVYHCPHHPEEGIGELRVVCNCRKPKPGMFIQAINELGIDPRRSTVIGDKTSDLKAAASAGVPRLVLLRHDGSDESREDIPFEDVEVIRSLKEFAL